MSGYVGTSPGTLTVQVPYGDQVQLMGPRGLGMIDPTRYWNYGRDDGRSPLPVQPMFRIGSGGKVTGLSGPVPQLLGSGHLGQPNMQLLGRPELQLLGRPTGFGLRQSHPNMQLMGRRDSPPDITLTGGRVIIPRPTLLGQAVDMDAEKKLAKRTIKIAVAAGLASMAGGILGAAIGAGKGRRGRAAGGAAIGGLLGPIGTAIGAAVGGGEGRYLQAGGGAVIGSTVAGLAAGAITYYLTEPANTPSGTA